MDTVITVDDPQLLPGEYFEVRYRLLPSGAWQSLPNQTTNTFTIPGLPAGNYEVEISFTDCDPVIKRFTVPPDPVVPDCDCVTVSDVHIQEVCSGGYTLNATLSTMNACGYQISVNGSVSNYATLPASFSIPVTTPGVDLIVSAYCCEQEKWIECYNAHVSDVRECVCTATLQVTSAVAEDLIGGGTRVTLTFTGSNPDVPPYEITIGSFQTSVNSAGQHQIDVPFNVPAGQIITVYNACGGDTTEVTRENPDPECDSDITIVSATKGYDVAFPGYYYIEVTFTENNLISPPYLIEIISSLAGGVVASLSVTTDGLHKVPIEKQYWGERDLTCRVSSPCDIKTATVT